MKIQRNHWLKAIGVAITLHAALLIGLRSQMVGVASPAQGPIIELAATLPGVAGSLNDNAETVSPAAVKEPLGPGKEDVKKPADPETQEMQPASIEPEVQQAVPEMAVRKPAIEKKKRQSSRALQAGTKRQKARALQLHKKIKRTVASKNGNAQKGSAGARRGGGRSKTNAGAINRYASMVRARILSRSPRSIGRRGTTVIVFQLSTSGGLRWARISRSSGNATLDQKAVGSVRRASPFPRPPAGSRSRHLRFSIPFRFH